jgi:hypothetical protein
MAAKTMVLTPAGLPPSAGAMLEIAEISHDLREEEGLHAALDALQSLALIADQVLSGIMVRRNPYLYVKICLLNAWIIFFLLLPIRLHPMCSALPNKFSEVFRCCNDRPCQYEKMTQSMFKDFCNAKAVVWCYIALKSHVLFSDEGDQGETSSRGSTSPR